MGWPSLTSRPLLALAAAGACFMAVAAQGVATPSSLDELVAAVRARDARDFSIGGYLTTVRIRPPVDGDTGEARPPTEEEAQLLIRGQEVTLAKQRFECTRTQFHCQFVEARIQADGKTVEAVTEYWYPGTGYSYELTASDRGLRSPEYLGFVREIPLPYANYVGVALQLDGAFGRTGPGLAGFLAERRPSLQWGVLCNGVECVVAQTDCRVEPSEGDGHSGRALQRTWIAPSRSYRVVRQVEYWIGDDGKRQLTVSNSRSFVEAGQGFWVPCVADRQSYVSAPNRTQWLSRATYLRYLDGVQAGPRDATWFEPVWPNCTRVHWPDGRVEFAGNDTGGLSAALQAGELPFSEALPDSIVADEGWR